MKKKKRKKQKEHTSTPSANPRTKSSMFLAGIALDTLANTSTKAIKAINWAYRNNQLIESNICAAYTINRERKHRVNKEIDVKRKRYDALQRDVEIGPFQIV